MTAAAKAPVAVSPLLRPPRLPLAFALALTLHLLAGLGLPAWLEQWRGTSRPPAIQQPFAKPLAAVAEGETIPIRLPLAGFRLQTQLQAPVADTNVLQRLPHPAASAAGALSLSNSLGSADRQAQALRQRPLAASRSLADLRLATVAIELPQVPAPRTVEAQHSVAATVAASVSVAAPAAREAAPAPAARPLAPRVRAPIPVVNTQGEAIPAAPPLPPPLPAYTPQSPVRAAAGAAVLAYRGAGSESIALAPPPSAATDQDRVMSAPERGVGEAVGSRGEFFQRLTTRLFEVNQQALAEAIRATPRVTLEVRFSIDRGGRVLDAQVVRSSGDAALDDKAVRVILRASPVPQLAPDMPQPRIELSFPVQVYR